MLYILKIKGTDKIPDFVQIRDENMSLKAYFRLDQQERGLVKNHFEQHKKEHTYPSTYLCYVTIIAKALGKENICGYLINTL